ncbi:MAG: hypothetical protein LBJ22_07050 [Synergistaceae bacterium]|jgi:hypothetical protein|nr:hypothetical protein [Synergistaceae bacterium]
MSFNGRFFKKAIERRGALPRTSLEGFARRALPVICLAGALFLGAKPAFALTVQGVPAWLEPHVLRGVQAVWEKIPPGEFRFDTLSLVTKRLFTGYDVTVEYAKHEDGEQPKEHADPHIELRPSSSARWSVVLTPPELRSPSSSWFEKDVRGMSEEITPLLEGLPVEALSWADAALKDRVGEIVERRLPGWDFSLLVRLGAEGEILQLSFHSQQPLVLAVSPSIFSSTLPVMFQSDLTAKLIPGLSPIIGTPVAWIARHRGDVESFAQEFLEDRNAVSNTRSEVKVDFVPAQVSEMNAVVNSESLVFQIWLAAFAGTEGRYPEAGVVAGWNTRRATGVDLEIYAEIIVDVSEFGLKNRLGFRFPLVKGTRGGDFRIGLEAEWPEQELWYRAWWDSQRLRRPYAWWRYNPEYGHNAALGYRLNEHISIEINYDGRYNDKMGLRGILSL